MRKGIFILGITLVVECEKAQEFIGHKVVQRPPNRLHALLVHPTSGTLSNWVITSYWQVRPNDEPLVEMKVYSKIFSSIYVLHGSLT
jgi:hypothetical protein